MNEAFLAAGPTRPQEGALRASNPCVRALCLFEATRDGEIGKSRGGQ